MYNHKVLWLINDKTIYTRNVYSALPRRQKKNNEDVFLEDECPYIVNFLEVVLRNFFKFYKNPERTYLMSDVSIKNVLGGRAHFPVFLALPVGHVCFGRKSVEASAQIPEHLTKA